MVAFNKLSTMYRLFEVNRLDKNILLLFSWVFFDVYNPKSYWVFEGYNKMQAVDFGECRRGHSPKNKKINETKNWVLSQTQFDYRYHT